MRDLFSYLHVRYAYSCYTWVLFATHTSTLTLGNSRGFSSQLSLLEIDLSHQTLWPCAFLLTNDNRYTAWERGGRFERITILWPILTSLMFFFFFVLSFISNWTHFHQFLPHGLPFPLLTAGDYFLVTFSIHFFYISFYFFYSSTALFFYSRNNVAYLSLNLSLLLFFWFCFLSAFSPNVFFSFFHPFSTLTFIYQWTLMCSWSQTFSFSLLSIYHFFSLHIDQLSSIFFVSFIFANLSLLFFIVYIFSFHFHFHSSPFFSFSSHIKFCYYLFLRFFSSSRLHLWTFFLAPSYILFAQFLALISFPFSSSIFHSFFLVSFIFQHFSLFFRVLFSRFRLCSFFFLILDSMFVSFLLLVYTSFFFLLSASILSLLYFSFLFSYLAFTFIFYLFKIHYLLLYSFAYFP